MVPGPGSTSVQPRIYPALKRRTRDHAMMNNTTKPDSWQPAAEMTVDLFDNRFDPIESEVRARARQFIEEMIRGELDTVLPGRVTGEARLPAMKKEPRTTARARACSRRDWSADASCGPRWRTALSRSALRNYPISCPELTGGCRRQHGVRRLPVKLWLFDSRRKSGAIFCGEYG